MAWPDRAASGGQPGVPPLRRPRGHALGKGEWHATIPLQKLRADLQRSDENAVGPFAEERLSGLNRPAPCSTGPALRMPRNDVTSLTRPHSGGGTGFLKP